MQMKQFAKNALLFTQWYSSLLKLQSMIIIFAQEFRSIEIHYLSQNKLFSIFIMIYLF